MTGPVKHKDIIKAWLDGATVEYKRIVGQWEQMSPPSRCDVMPMFHPETEYRIKPDPVERWAITFVLHGNYQAVVCFESEDRARASLLTYSATYPNARVIKIREVIEDA